MNAKILPFAAVFLALPAAAYAGHVESAILRQGTPAKWWKENKTQVLERQKRLNATEAKKETPVLEDKLGPDRQMARSVYLQSLLSAVNQASPEEQQACWNGEKTWRADLAVFHRRYPEILRHPLVRDASLSAKTWMTKIHEGLSGEANRAKRLAAFVALERVRETVATSLHRMDRLSDDKFLAEKEMADLVLILKFLRPENKSFFLNGYSNEALNPNPSYGSLYTHLQWDERSINAVRKETFQVLAEIGSPAVPTLRRALADLGADSRDGGKTVSLPARSLATSTQWSTKEVRFRVATHPAFRKEAEELILKAGTPPELVRVDVMSVDVKAPKPAPVKEEPKPAPVAEPAKPDPAARAVAERRNELLQYTGVQSVEAQDGSIRIRVATEEDANDLRLLLGDEALGFKIAIVVS